MLARKKWAKFGDAQRYKPGDESMTAVSIEEIFRRARPRDAQVRVREVRRRARGDGELEHEPLGVSHLREEGGSLDD